MNKKKSPNSFLFFAFPTVGIKKKGGKTNCQLDVIQITWRERNWLLKQHKKESESSYSPIWSFKETKPLWTQWFTTPSLLRSHSDTTLTPSLFNSLSISPATSIPHETITHHSLFSSKKPQPHDSLPHARTYSSKSRKRGRGNQERKKKKKDQERAREEETYHHPSHRSTHIKTLNRGWDIDIPTTKPPLDCHWAIWRPLSFPEVVVTAVETSPEPYSYVKHQSKAWRANKLLSRAQIQP